ncbi:MAG: HTH domain-containing protein [Microcystis aeruginosa Ma_QC_Ch_20071001_S25D]|uniref:HTH domain-containing protein n=1 Tax=Microcystis aeruginosa Ma_QC_Ch_20071001_S25D TaxID=2486250 RepID=A0A552FQB2_MICAE|nr:MAG: HTH domain-containing protein [Microcystis aeruginosa Ma_QC_Ch_20071001_S25D]TRU56588.1 MAG: HTH domain-containing protein [Microcystis aeruginosa Ma_QC_Ch_20071001_M135]
MTTTQLTSLSGKLTKAEIVIYLYLIAANPFSDHLHELDTSVIAENLGVTRRTVQRTLRKLEELGLIQLEIKSFTYRRKEDENTEELGDSRIAKRQQDRQGDSRIAKATAGSPKRQQDRQGKPEALQDKDSETSKTIKTIKTFQTATDGAGVETFSEDKLTPSKISQEIIDRLGELDIPINKKIEEAIEKHGEGQAIRAINHIKETAGTIKSKYAIFLYQIGNIQADSRKQLSREFLEWYQYARNEIAEDIPPELLPLDHHGEPLIRMRSRPGELIAWQRAKSGENFTRLSGEYLRAALEKIAPNFANKLRKGGKK